MNHYETQGPMMVEMVRLATLAFEEAAVKWDAGEYQEATRLGRIGSSYMGAVDILMSSHGLLRDEYIDRPDFFNARALRHRWGYV